MVRPGVLAVNIFRVAQKEKRYHGKEGVSHRVYAALFVEKKKKVSCEIDYWEAKSESCA